VPLTPNQAIPYQTQDDQLGPEGAEAMARAVEPLLVMVFASAADRNARLPDDREGMLCWLQDVNRHEQYTGSAWVEVPNLTRVTGLISAYDSRPQGRVVGGFATTNISLTASYQKTVSATFSNPSMSRSYAMFYNDLFYTSTASNDVVDVICTVATGSSASSGAPTVMSWQVPIAGASTEGGTRLTMTGRAGGFPTGTVTLGCFAKISTGSGIISSGAKFLEIDDVGI
jgi:hypothetical protein